MTDEVADLVLKHNYQQVQAISLTELKAVEYLQTHASLIDDFERIGLMNRELEFLPDKEEFERRRRQGKGLTRPELGVLISYSKILFTQNLLESDFLDAPELDYWAKDYFPKPIQKQFPDEIMSHQLKREIIATRIANSVINRMGPTFVRVRVQKTGMSPVEVAKSYLIVREAFGLQSLWGRIEALDNIVPAHTQLNAMKSVISLIQRETTWLLTRRGKSLDVSTDIERFKRGVKQLKSVLNDNLSESTKQNIENKFAQLTKEGLPEDIARDIAEMPALGSAYDIIRIADESSADIAHAANIYYQLGDVFHLDWLREQAHKLPVNNKWNDEALDGLIDQLYSCQTGLAVHILKALSTQKKKIAHCDMVHHWINEYSGPAKGVEHIFKEIRASAKIDIGMLIIVEQRLRALFGG